MNTRNRLANSRAILKATREDLARHRICAAEARRQLLAVMLKISIDPAQGHLRYCEVGRLYVERERALTRVSLAEGSCLTLRQEVANLKQQLANERHPDHRNRPRSKRRCRLETKRQGNRDEDASD